MAHKREKRITVDERTDNDDHADQGGVDSCNGFGEQCSPPSEHPVSIWFDAQREGNCILTSKSPANIVIELAKEPLLTQIEKRPIPKTREPGTGRGQRL